MGIVKLQQCFENLLQLRIQSASIARDQLLAKAEQYEPINVQKSLKLYNKAIEIGMQNFKK